MRYRKVVQAYWEGDLARFLRGDPKGHTVAFYLLTCPAANAVGCYRLSRATICDDVGFDVTESLKRLSGSTPGVLGKYLETPFVVLDDEYRMVFVVEFARHEWGEVPHPDNNRVKGLAKMLPDMASVGRKSLCWKAFRDRYGAPWKGLLQVLGDDFASTPEVLAHDSSRARQDQDQDSVTGETHTGEARAGDQTALIEGMETKAPKKTIAQQRAEVAAEVYAHYQMWQPHWARALLAKAPPKIKLSKSKVEVIGQFYPDYEVANLKAAVDHVIHDAFLMGQHGGGSEGRPRLTVDDIFKKNGKINKVEILINKTAADANMSQKISQVISERDRWEREQAEATPS